MSSRRFGLAILACLCALGGGLILGSSAMALNVHTYSSSFGEEGAGNGQLNEPSGVAVNETTHNVYVVDRGNKRVEEFTSTGAYVGQFVPPGGFDSPSAIAIDNSDNPLDPSAGDVYVVDDTGIRETHTGKFGRKVIDKFSETGVFEGALTAGVGGEQFEGLAAITGIAVDPAGTLWVSMVRENAAAGGGAELIVVESFSDGQTNVPDTRINDFGTSSAGFAVDSEDRLSAASSNHVQQRTASGERSEFHINQGTGLSAELTNNELYVAEGTQVTAYDLEQRVVEQFGSGRLTASTGIAVDSSTGTVYVADPVADRIDVFGQIVIPDTSTGEEPTNLQHEGSVTLDGTVNPDGLPVTSCEFEYGTSSSYGSTSVCESSPGSGSSPVAVHADVSGLTPLTEYHYRLVASNANGTSEGIDRTFIAATQPKVDGESVSNVASGSATFDGLVNPGGAETTYRFEYGPSSAYGQSLSGNAGSGFADVEVSVHPQNLQPGTFYHYRLVAESPLGVAVGEDGTFTTQPSAGSSGLPDGRAWEMVSPPNKQGASLESLGGNGQGGGNLVQAASDGSALTYDATGPTEEAPPGDRSPENVQIYSRDSVNGWSTNVIATPHDPYHVGLAAGSETEYKLFSTDLSMGLVEPQGTMLLSEEASERTPYLRHDETCESDPAGCYQPLVTAGNVAQGVKFGGNPQSVAGEAEFAGATPDLSHVLLYSKVALTTGGARGLYEWVSGRLTFIANMEVGPLGEARHGISADGSRVIGTIGGKYGELVMRDIPEETTVKLDKVEPGGAGGQDWPVFQAASSDGARVFFEDSAQLTANSTGISNQTASQSEFDLYEYNEATGRVSDLSVPLTSGEHADVQGSVIGTSEDGSYVYFVANGVLANGATPGNCESEEQATLSPSATCNLYVSHEGVVRFIATLSQEDSHSFGIQLQQLTARVSPDGRWLAFMSSRELTGYDNIDANSGMPDQEVYLYHATEEAGGSHPVCVSCDPTGGRPAGVLDVAPSITNEQPSVLVDSGDLWGGHWLSGLIPGWTNGDGSHTLYQSRYLSDSGRLFFDSDEALTPQDTNGTWDVYEYETAGVGNCESSGAGFVQASDGCVNLISSGGSKEESAFLDASENGDDVFFLTSAGLVSQDFDGSPDVYDAHVCSSERPCPPPSAVAPPPCTTGDSCKAAPSPQPTAFGEPSSETFSGAGNLAASSDEVRVAPKSLTKAQMLARALKACKRKRSKQKRASCERQARKRYPKKAVGSRVGKSAGRTGAGGGERNGR